MDKIPHIRCSRLNDKYYKHDPDCDDPSRVFLDGAAELASLRARVEELEGLVEDQATIALACGEAADECRFRAEAAERRVEKLEKAIETTLRDWEWCDARERLAAALDAAREGE